MRYWLSIILSGLIMGSVWADGEKSMDVMSGNVARSAFTTDIENREPIDAIGETLGNDVGEIKYFTDLRNLSGQTVTHRWQHNGEIMAEVSFDVGADRWRVWSSKRLVPQWLGQWKVSVVDGSGNTIAENSFVYQDSSM